MFLFYLNLRDSDFSCFLAIEHRIDEYFSHELVLKATIEELVELNDAVPVLVELLHDRVDFVFGSFFTFAVVLADTCEIVQSFEDFEHLIFVYNVVLV